MSRRSNPYLPSTEEVLRIGKDTLIRTKGKRSVVKIGKDSVVRNRGRLNRRIVIGVPTLGVIRIEWDVHRRGQTIPINWQVGEITSTHMPPTVIAEGYHTADAQNVIVERAVLDNYEWCLLWEDDVLPPFDALYRMNNHMEAMKAPVLSGLYYSKGEPTWPLVFRGRGNGAYRNWALGDEVWVDGVPTGFLLIHGDVLRWFWQNSEEYKLPDGRKMRRVFEFPRKSWFDPEEDRYFAQMGTSDLFWCDRILKEQVFKKIYPKGHPFHKFATMKYPFLVDTKIFAQQIDHNGKYYPAGCREVLPPLKGVQQAS